MTTRVPLRYHLPKVPKPSKPERPEQYEEGPSASRTFSDAVRDLLGVPKAEIDKREKVYQRSRARKKKRATAS